MMYVYVLYTGFQRENVGGGCHVFLNLYSHRFRLVVCIQHVLFWLWVKPMRASKVERYVRYGCATYCGFPLCRTTAHGILLIQQDLIAGT